MSLCPGLPRRAGTTKIKPICILLEQEIEWQWHQLGHMQACTSLHTDNHASTSLLSFFYRPDGLPAAQPTASLKAPEISMENKLVNVSSGNHTNT